MIRIVHVISDLNAGGAATMLANLVNGMNRSRFANSIISLTDRSQLGDAMEAAGTPVHSLGMRRGRPDVSALPKLIRLLRVAQPMLVQSWLYHADFLTVIAARFAGSPSVVWNLRCSNMDLRYYPRQTLWVLRALAVLSRLPAAVVVNSLAGQALHQRLGYRPRRWDVIPNGFDLTRFRPDAAARQRTRAELNLPPDAVLVALVARVDPAKDHATFLAAASLVAARRADVHFLLIGKDTPTLAPMVAARGLVSRVYSLGPRSDVDRLFPGIDICCLSSAFGEGFPNVLGEAMACGVPCVVTDVGDSAWVVGETGKVVPPRDPDALARACEELIEMGSQGRQQLGLAARQRVEKHFNLSEIVARYEQCYEELAAS